MESKSTEVGVGVEVIRSRRRSWIRRRPESESDLESRSSGVEVGVEIGVKVGVEFGVEVGV